MPVRAAADPAAVAPFGRWLDHARTISVGSDLRVVVAFPAVSFRASQGAIGLKPTAPVLAARTSKVFHPKIGDGWLGEPAELC